MWRDRAWVRSNGYLGAINSRVDVDQDHRQSCSSRQREYLVGGQLHRRTTPQACEAASRPSAAGRRRPHHDLPIGHQLEIDGGAGPYTKELTDRLGHRHPTLDVIIVAI